MYLSDLIEADVDKAFASFHQLVAPALRALARFPLKRARHLTDPCEGPTPGDWCADCQGTVNDLLVDTFGRLRRSLGGTVPRTRHGEPVRELALVIRHLHSREARCQQIGPLASALLHGPQPGDPAWLRAVWAQLVHYPTLRLEERVRRDDAVARGGSAHPDRDLRTAAWAAPLRADPLALELLLAFLGRLRHRALAPHAMPPDLLARHDIDATFAKRRLIEVLAWLRKRRPQFYAANVTAQLLTLLPRPEVWE